MPIIYPNKSIQLSPGMVNDLKDGSADMIVTALTILYSRKYVIDFLHPIMPEIGGKDFPFLIVSHCLYLDLNDQDTRCYL